MGARRWDGDHLRRTDSLRYASRRRADLPRRAEHSKATANGVKVKSICVTASPPAITSANLGVATRNHGLGVKTDANPCSTKSLDSGGLGGEALPGLKPDLETRSDRLKYLSKGKWIADAWSPPEDFADTSDPFRSKQLKTNRQVTWADDKGAPLCTSLTEITKQKKARGVNLWSEKEVFGNHYTPNQAGAPSYKDVLLSNRKSSQGEEAPTSLRHRVTRRAPPPLSRIKRCFRCLSTDHLIRDCRDPLRCALCLRTGHRAKHCSRRGPTRLTNMQTTRVFRPHIRKVFIPLTEEFFKRQAQRQCAVLADVIGRSRLGHSPQVTIASDLAARFGGFTTDFLAARHHERDFVILLPDWVRPEDLTNRGLINLAHCRLDCVPWEPYARAARSRISYKAWIRIENLPFECWSANRVSAVVNGFGRFLKADDSSTNMMDLTGFRCSVAVDDLADIPEHLAISLGDIVITVPIRIESTAPFGGEDRGIPFGGGDRNEGEDQTDPLGMQLARRVSTLGVAGGDSDSRDGYRSDQGSSWNSSELRDRRRDLESGRKRPAPAGQAHLLAARKRAPVTVVGSAPRPHRRPVHVGLPPVSPVRRGGVSVVQPSPVDPTVPPGPRAFAAVGGSPNASGLGSKSVASSSLCPGSRSLPLSSSFSNCCISLGLWPAEPTSEAVRGFGLGVVGARLGLGLVGFSPVCFAGPPCNLGPGWALENLSPPVSGLLAPDGVRLPFTVDRASSLASLAQPRRPNSAPSVFWLSGRVPNRPGPIGAPGPPGTLLVFSLSSSGMCAPLCSIRLLDPPLPPAGLLPSGCLSVGHGPLSTAQPAEPARDATSTSRLHAVDLLSDAPPSPFCPHPTTRCSPRLTSRPCKGALELAMVRKAALRDVSPMEPLPDAAAGDGRVALPRARRMTKYLVACSSGGTSPPRPAGAFGIPAARPDCSLPERRPCAASFRDGVGEHLMSPASGQPPSTGRKGTAVALVGLPGTTPLAATTSVGQPRAPNRRSLRTAQNAASIVPVPTLPREEASRATGSAPSPPGSAARRKIMNKSAKCGIRLSEEDARNYLDFVRSAV